MNGRGELGLLSLALLTAITQGCGERAAVGDTMTDADRSSASPLVGSSNVCGFTAEVALSRPDEDGFVRIPPYHPNMFYMGRVDCVDKSAPAFAFPGVSIRARFEGDAIDMLLRDGGNPDVVNYYNVIIDHRSPVVIAVSPDIERYPLGRRLGPGPHVVEVFKRGESGPYSQPNSGRAEFHGFLIQGEVAILPIVGKRRRMEFIGDSITCGYGNEVSTTMPEAFPYSSKNSNAYMGFGAIAARTLDAEYMAVAYSGRGLIRNFAGEAGDPVPEMYLAALPDDPSSPPWDVNAYTPDVVVINLGTNDFSEGLELEGYRAMRESFRARYLSFLKELRGYYPDAAIVATLGPMINDSWPEGYAAWTSIQSDVRGAIGAQRKTGDENIHLLMFPPQSPPYGEDWHPTLETHEEMAARLVAYILEHDLFETKSPPGRANEK